MNHREPLVLNSSHYVSQSIHQKVDTTLLQYVSSVKSATVLSGCAQTEFGCNMDNMMLIWIFLVALEF